MTLSRFHSKSHFFFEKPVRPQEGKSSFAGTEVTSFDRKVSSQMVNLFNLKQRLPHQRSRHIPNFHKPDMKVL